MDTMAGNLFLIGLMGAGKTTLGKQLALQLSRAFYDSDQEICVRTGVSIPTIFELEGEAGFRAREAAVIDEITQKTNIVLATGGGAILQPTNREKLRSRGQVVYLHAQPELLLMRTRYDKNRPLLQVADPLAKLQDLYAQRDPIYRSAAHHIIDVNDQYAQQTLSRIIHTLSLESHSCIR
ncbi:shikimate kinase [Snodgrassella sp. CFCC 13594]|uniref:shikimate kinase n=1 Tax=Snodgrassella sp. CFCC 13594 TaxID=1775559 RepID=UPI00350F4E14